MSNSNSPGSSRGGANSGRAHKYTIIKDNDSTAAAVSLTESSSGADGPNSSYQHGGGNASYLDEYRSKYPETPEEAKAFVNLQPASSNASTANSDKSPSGQENEKSRTVTAFELLRQRSREEWEYETEKQQQMKKETQKQQQAQEVMERVLVEEERADSPHVTFNLAPPPSFSPPCHSSPSSVITREDRGANQDKQPSATTSASASHTYSQSNVESSQDTRATASKEPSNANATATSSAATSAVATPSTSAPTKAQDKSAHTIYCHKCHKYLKKASFSKNQLSKRKTRPDNAISCKACNLHSA